MKPRKVSIRAKLAAGFFLFAFLPLAALGFVMFKSSRSDLLESRSDSLESLVGLMKMEAVGFSQNALSRVIMLSRMPELRRAAKSIVEGREDVGRGVFLETLDDIVSHDSGIRTCRLLHPVTGEMLGPKGPHPGAESFDWGAYLEPGMRAPDIHPIQYYPSLGKNLMAVTAPVEDGGRLLGVLVCMTDVDQLSDVLSTLSGVRAGLVTRAGRRVLDVEGPGEAAVVSEGVRRALGGGSGSGIYPDEAGVDVVGAYAYIGPLDLALVAEVPLDDVYANADRLGSRIFMISLGMAVFALLASLVVGHRITGPLMGLAGLMRKYGEQGGGTGVEIEGGGREVAELAGAFNRMIEQRDRYERALAESEDRYRTIMETANDAIFIADPETGLLLDCNQKACELLGRQKDEIVGMNQTDLHPTEDSRVYAEQFKMSVELGSYMSLDREVCRKDGSRVPVEISASMFEIGGRRYMQGIFRDVTERKRMDEALRGAKKKLETLIDAIPDLVFFKDGVGRHLLVNQAAADFSGVSREDFEGRTAGDLFPPDLGMACQRSDDDVIMGRKPVHLEEHARDRKGEAVYLDTIKVPIYDDKGELDGVVCIARDITGRKHMEERLKESERKYRNLVELTTDIIYISDSRGNQVYMNDAAFQALEALPEEVIGRPWSAWIHPDDREATFSIFREMVEKGIDVFNFENRYVSKTGRVINALHNVKVIRDAEGGITGTQGIARDITERKRMEEALVVSIKEKEMLIREIHHRVKNNLSIVSSLLSLQARHLKDKTARGALSEGRNRVKAMSLIHEKLYSSGDFKGVNVASYIRSLAVQLFRSYDVSEARVGLDLDVDHAIELDVDTIIPCGLILNELIANALKHAFPEGRTGRVKVVFARYRTGRYLLSVSDNGVGFPPDLDFRDTDSLGMQLVTSLSAQIGAEVEMDGQEGTTFRVTFAEKHFREDDKPGR